MKITLLTGKTFDIKEEVGIDIKVVQSASSRKLTLRIDAKNHIPILSVPRFCSRKKAINFVNENMDWILEGLQKLPESRTFQNGEKVSLFGQEVTIIHCPQAKRGVWLQDGNIFVSGDIEFLHRRVRDFIKTEAQKEFFILSKELADKLGCKLHRVFLKDTKSRWGSCSSLGNINYSWRIALAPKYVIDYLMAHEVAHLKHPDHSDEFWACVYFLYPDWTKGRSWLNKHGKELYAYL